MASYGGLILKYGTDPSRPITLKKYFLIAGGASDWLSGLPATIDMSAVTVLPTPGNASGVAVNMLLALQEAVASDVQVFDCHADWRTSAGPNVIEASAPITVTNFEGASSAPGYGPKKKGFIAFPMIVSATNKTGWLRFYTTGQAAWTVKTNFQASDLSTILQNALNNLRAFSGSLENYVVWSGALTPGGSWLNQAGPDPNLGHLGSRNG